MGKDFLTAAAWTLRLGVWLVIGLAAWRPCFAQDTTLTLPPLTASNAAAQGNSTIVRTGAETPASQDPVSVFTTAKPGVELYVAVARLYEESGRLAEAEQQYKKGLKESPDDLRALLGYARLKDRLGQTEESLNLYRKAVKAHPDEPSVYNNLAVHYAHHGLLTHAVAAMQRAIRLRPREVKYRDNIATALIQLNRPQEAFAHLCTVHDEASAHYDLGFLMVRTGQRQAAALQFSLALRMNPSLVQARQWLDRLSGRPGAMERPQPPMIAASGPRPDPSPEPRIAVRVAPMPDQPGPPPSDGVERAAILAGALAGGARDCAAAGGVVVRCVAGSGASLRPAAWPAARAPAADWTPPQRLPPAADGSAGPPAAPRFPDPPRDDPPAPLPPSPP